MSAALLYPMGDRGGTATGQDGAAAAQDYTRWEIGGEPQQEDADFVAGDDYTRWEIGGEPQQRLPYQCRG